MKIPLFLFLELSSLSHTSTATSSHGAIIANHRRSFGNAIQLSNGNGRFASSHELGMTKDTASDYIDGPRSSKVVNSSRCTEGVTMKQDHEQTVVGPVRSQWETKGSQSKGYQRHQKQQTLNQARRPSSDFDAQIIKLYEYPGGIPSEIDSFVREWLPKWAQGELSSFMRISGKKSRSRTFLHLKRHLPSIASRIEVFTSAWKLRDISAILYSLQCLGEDDDGYLAILAVMTKAMSESIGKGEAASSISISLTLLGLQKNRLRERQSIELLRSVTMMINSCKESLSAQAVGNALYGMQSMSSDHAEVRSMISALSGKVHSCKESLDAQAVGNALYGMQSMSSDHCKEVLDLLTRCVLQSPTLTSISRTGLLSVGQAILLCIPSRRDVLGDARYKAWTAYGDLACREHRRRITSGECKDSFRSQVEQRVHSVAVRLLSPSCISTSSNEYLFDMFESDIVVRVPSNGSTDEAESPAGNGCMVVNIEVDGMHHRQEKKMKFCKLRDAYLKSRGVLVHRIDASHMSKMDDSQLERWVQDAVAESLVQCGRA